MSHASQAVVVLSVVLIAIASCLSAAVEVVGVTALSRAIEEMRQDRLAAMAVRASIMAAERGQIEAIAQMHGELLKVLRATCANITDVRTRHHACPE